jgi:hypothetical protein
LLNASGGHNTFYSIVYLERNGMKNGTLGEGVALFENGLLTAPFINAETK